MKLCRREGINLFGSEKYNLADSHRKPLGAKFGKLSLFGKQLRKKQAAKRMFGLSEKQFAAYYKKAVRMTGVTGDNMLSLLERRLDNVVFKSSFARTIMQSRQFVNHGHFQVNGIKVDIPSFQISVGDVISLRDKMKNSPLYKTLVQEFEEFASKNSQAVASPVKWLEIDAKNLSITVLALPERTDFDQSIDIKSIIEFYSK